MLACFAGHFLYSFAAFAGFACKSSKTIPFVSAVGAKSGEKGKAQHVQAIDVDNPQQAHYTSGDYSVTP